MSDIKAILGTMRLPFLILTPACIFLGYSSAVWSSEGVNGYHLLLALIGGLCAHISVNSLNEYFDFKSGLDFKTKPTPFSGGSGTLPAKPEAATLALATGLLSLAATALVGLYFIQVRGMALLPLGLLGILLIITYTIWLSRIPIVCLIAPGLGCGILMVMGTDFVLSDGYSWTAFFSSLVPFFTVNNLLLLNQFPDVDADRSVGRRNFPIVIGRQACAYLYGLFLALSYISIIVGAWIGYLPWASLLGLVSLAIAVPTFIGVYRHAEDIEKLMPYLGLNVIITLMTPVLVAIGLLIS